MICQLAHSILDGTVFEIAHGLKDIQAITETTLSAKRNVIVSKGAKISGSRCQQGADVKITPRVPLGKHRGLDKALEVSF